MAVLLGLRLRLRTRSCGGGAEIAPPWAVADEAAV